MRFPSSTRLFLRFDEYAVQDIVLCESVACYASFQNPSSVALLKSPESLIILALFILLMYCRQNMMLDCGRINAQTAPMHDGCSRIRRLPISQLLLKPRNAME